MKLLASCFLFHMLVISCRSTELTETEEVHVTILHLIVNTIEGLFEASHDKPPVPQTPEKDGGNPVEEIFWGILNKIAQSSAQGGVNKYLEEEKKKKEPGYVPKELLEKYERQHIKLKEYKPIPTVILPDLPEDGTKISFYSANPDAPYGRFTGYIVSQLSTALDNGEDSNGRYTPAITAYGALSSSGDEMLWLKTIKISQNRWAFSFWGRDDVYLACGPFSVVLKVIPQSRLDSGIEEIPAWTLIRQSDGSYAVQCGLSSRLQSENVELFGHYMYYDDFIQTQLLDETSDINTHWLLITETSPNPEEPNDITETEGPDDEEELIGGGRREHGCGGTFSTCDEEDPFTESNSNS